MSENGIFLSELASAPAAPIHLLGHAQSQPPLHNQKSDHA